MEKVLKQVEVAKNSDELAQGLVKFVAALKVALADGFQPGSDIPPIVSAAIADIMPVVGNLSKVDDDLAELPVETVRALALAAGDIAALFVKPKAPAVVAPEAAPSA